MAKEAVAERAELLKEPPSDAQDVRQQEPREVAGIPASLMNKETRDELSNFLAEQIDEAEIERSEFIKKLARWKVAYRAPIATKPKNFPIHNASNITTSVIKEAVNTIVAQVVQATMTARPWWIMQDLAAEWEPMVDAIEDFMSLAAERDLGIDEAMVDAITEMCKLGTTILTEEWEVDERKVYNYTADGKSVYPRTVTDHDGPRLTHIPLQRFWIRFTERSIQKAQWCGTELWMTEKELKGKRDQGKFHSIDGILVKESDAKLSDPVQEGQEKIEKTIPHRQKKYRVFRLYVSYDIDNDGKLEELLLYYHRESNTIIGDFFNPYWHGKRPFIKMGYFPVEDRFYDEGLCEMLEGLQRAISSWVNRRADNATMANLKMFIKRKMARGLNPGDPLYLGKIIEVTDIHNDIKEFSMAEIYPSTVQEEQLLQQRANRVSGLSEASLGSASPVTRTTAAAQLALLQEASKRIDLTVRNVRNGFNQIGWFTLQLYFQYGTLGKGLAWMGDRGRIVDAVFRLPRRANELGFAIRAQTPTSLVNKQVQRENKLQIYQLLLQAHESILPLAAQFAPDALPEIARGLVVGTKKFLTDALETFDETDPEGILASLSVLEKVLPQGPNFGGVGFDARAAETDKLLTDLGRVEALLREAEATRDSLGRTTNRGHEGAVRPAPGLLPSSPGPFGPGGEPPQNRTGGNGALQAATRGDSR